MKESYVPLQPEVNLFSAYSIMPGVKANRRQSINEIKQKYTITNTKHCAFSPKHMINKDLAKFLNKDLVQ